MTAIVAEGLTKMYGGPDDVATVLTESMAWAEPPGLSLDGLEAGPPSLEDAYLATTGNHSKETPS